MKTNDEIKAKFNELKIDVKKLSVKIDEAKTTDEALKYQPMLNSLCGQLSVLEWVLDFELI